MLADGFAGYVAQGIEVTACCRSLDRLPQGEEVGHGDLWQRRLSLQCITRSKAAQIDWGSGPVDRGQGCIGTATKVPGIGKPCLIDQTRVEYLCVTDIQILLLRGVRLARPQQGATARYCRRGVDLEVADRQMIIRRKLVIDLPSHTRKVRAVAILCSPGSNRSITSPRLTRSHAHSFFARIARAVVLALIEGPQS